MRPGVSWGVLGYPGLSWGIRPTLICVRILNYANYRVFSIRYTLNMSKVILVGAILPNTLQKVVETNVMPLTSKHTCTTLVTSCKETSLPV